MPSADLWLTILTVALSAIVTLDVLLFKRRPVSAVLWLAVAWSVPIWGALVYAIFGVDRIRTSAIPWLDFSIRPDRDAGGTTASQYYRSTTHVAAEDGGPGWHVLRATEPAVRDFRVCGGNDVELLVDGEAFYNALLRSIESAKHSIHLQSYIFGRDAVSRRVLDALAAKAKEGVQVRVLYDRFGSTFALVSGLFRSARRAGARIKPTRTWGHINLRNHRKLAVLDGHTAFVGGMNIDKRNVAPTWLDPAAEPEAPDRDYHTRLLGPAVADVQVLFLADWAHACRKRLTDVESPEHFPELTPAGSALVQVVPGGPDVGGTGLTKAYFGAIASAAESLTIVTPYFLPDDAIFEALRFAALRGVDVRVVLPARSNHWVTSCAARALYAPLLRAGVKIHERGAPFMHAKALVVDEVYAMLGSANLDYRSLHLNFELNIEVVEREFVHAVAGQLRQEIEESREVLLATHESRSVLARLKENLCRLLQPVL